MPVHCSVQISLTPLINFFILLRIVDWVSPGRDDGCSPALLTMITRIEYFYTIALESPNKKRLIFPLDYEKKSRGSIRDSGGRTINSML